MLKTNMRGGWVGILVGVTVFLLGCGLLLFTFRLAFDLFVTDPHIPGEAGKPIEVGLLVSSFLALVTRILVLFVMAIVGGMVANRGIRLYLSGRGPAPASEDA